MVRILTNAMEKGLVRDGVIAKNEAEGRNLWRLRENLSDAQKYEGGSIKHDISVPVSAIPAFLIEAGGVVESVIPGARPLPFGHLGDGNLHYNISQPPDMDKQAFLDKWDTLNRQVHDVVRKFNGSFSAEHGIGRMKVDEMSHYKTKVELDLMRRIKTALDPDTIMNPGVILKQQEIP